MCIRDSTITVTAPDSFGRTATDTFTLQGHTIPTLVHSGTWTTTATGGDALAGTVGIHVDFAVSGNASLTPPANDTLNTIPVYSDDTRQGTSSLSTVFNWDSLPEGSIDPAATDAGTGVMTITFTEAVTNPILHLDRLGGFGDLTWNGMRFTLLTPGVTLEELSGTAQFEVDELNGTCLLYTSRCV